MKKALSSNKQIIVDLLTQAFDSNPSINYIIQQDQKRAERIRKLMEYSFEICNAFGSIYLSDDLKACALILLPDKKRTTFRTLLLNVQFVFSVVGLHKVKRIIEREKMIHKGYPKNPFIYLWFLGVEPAYQRRGIGSILLQEVLEESKCTGRPVFLETSLPENVSFYEKHGFVVYNELKFDRILYCMKRE
jgi:ribosomal protein S18 acetylase RimI-like enzyme